jgi:Helicase conserved C-terminal domain/SNF2-related domain/PLD-like domain
MSERPFPPVFATNRLEKGESVAEEVNRLLRGLREQLAVPPTVAIATAYLNAQGFELLADELERAPGVRLMIGAEPQQPEERMFARRPSDAELLEKAIADHELGLRDERDLAGFTVERDVAERRIVAWLRKVDENGVPRVQVRRYVKGFLHGKAYIPENDLAGILAGSSNLTYAGLRLNRELNLGYETGAHKRLVRDWFEELWADAEPYDLAGMYEERFLLHDPWIVFLRMLVTMYGYPGDEDAAYEPVLRLTGFQRDGVARIRRIIDEWGGALLADEVGLGKTFLAGELIAEATKRDRQRALIVVPAALKDSMWIPFLDAWDLTSARVKVMSYDELRLADENELKRLDEYALVVVDEAHNLRNPATARADTVRRLLSGAYPKHLLLMTATPVNNSLLDLHTLVGYFVKNDAAFASRGIPSLFRYVREAQAQDPETLSPAHLFALLDEIAVRRTRGFVKRHYAGSTIRNPAGKEIPIEFPTPRVERIDYTLDPAGEELLDRVITALRPADSDSETWRPGREPMPGRLTMARYVPSRYAISDKVEAVQVVNAGFLRSGLLKRLESSPWALAKTLGVVIEHHEDFLRALGQGMVLRGRALQAWGEADEDVLVEEIVAALGDDGLDTISELGAYHGAELIADVEADLVLLRELQVLADRVATGRDPKADHLVAKLEEIATAAARPSRDGDLSESDRRKVIVFSTFADTIEDLHARVTEAIEAAPADSPLAAFKGRVPGPVRGRKMGIDQTARARILAGFAPATAGPLRDDGTPIATDRYDLLLTTDVLSEGVNLQQAGRIINYDLPWNPMRLVQRHGRIDRIGSRHREVHLGCFFPSSGLDELLGLEETIQRKIAYAAVSVGIGDVIPGQKAKRIEVVLADNREQIEKLREERPELFESGGDSAALSGEEYRRRLELALQDGLIRSRVERLPMASGTGFKSPLATEHGWVFATEVGPDREARLAFVAATPFWGVRRDDDGGAEVDESPLTCLTYADPGDRSTYAELSDPAYSGVFNAWPEARRAIWRSWMRLTDPANLQPDVKGVLRRAADLVRDGQSPLSAVERDTVAVALAQRWPIRISREVGRILDDTDRPVSDRIVALRKVVDEEGLQAPPPPVPLPAIEEDEVRLVAWMAVIPARDAWG